MGQGFVPVVDVGPALADNAVGRVDVAAAIDEACRTSGFFVITGHGIDPELLREINELTVAFFTGDEAVKSGCVADERVPDHPGPVPSTFLCGRVVGHRSASRPL